MLVNHRATAHVPKDSGNVEFVFHELRQQFRWWGMALPAWVSLRILWAHESDSEDEAACN